MLNRSPSLKYLLLRALLGTLFVTLCAAALWIPQAMFGPVNDITFNYGSDPYSQATATAIDQNNCWQGDAPKPYDRKIPPYVLIRKHSKSYPQLSKRVGLALEVVFNGKTANFNVLAFCKGPDS